MHDEASGSDCHASAEAAQCLTSLSASASIQETAMAPPAPHSKPARLSLACNTCRRRKVRCDARQPKCSNCTSRGDDCETSDLRRQGAPSGPRKLSTRRRTGSTRLGQPSSLKEDQQTPLRPMRDQPRTETTQLQSTSNVPALQTETRSLSTEGPLPRRARLRHSPRASQSEVHLDPGTASSGRARSTRSQAHSHGSREEPNITWLSRAYQQVSAAQAEALAGEEGATDEQQDPAAVTPDVVVNTDGSNRLKVLGGSSLQCLFKFTDLWLAGYGFDATTPLFGHGMSHSEEFQMNLFPTFPDLPQQPLLSRCVDAFFNRVWPVFPVIDQDTLNRDVDGLLKLQERDSEPLQSKLQPSWIPNLTIVYAVICLGLNEVGPLGSHQGISSDMRTEYLMACYSSHIHLTATPYLSSIQGLVLLALALRSCGGKDGQSWYITGHAVRLALSLGLHKIAGNSPADGPYQPKNHRPPSESIKKRLWWSCFSLERLQQLECGRASSIDHSFDEVLEERGFHVTEIENDPEVEVDSTFAHFSAWVSLAVIMGRISHRLYSQRFSGAVEMLGETARLARSLTVWEAGLPEHLRPQVTSNTVDAGHHEVLNAFLSQQYHHAQIAVLRTAIVFPDKSFKTEVQKQSLEVPEISRIYGGAGSCVHAARSLVMQTLELADAGVHSTLLGVPPTFLASVVLALSILRAPSSRLARSDVELLTSATEYVEACYQAWGFPAPFLAILSRLRERTSAVFRGEAKTCGVVRRGENNPVGSGTEAALGVAGSEGVFGATGSLQAPESSSLDQPETLNHLGPFNVDDLAMSGVTGFEAFTSLEFEDMWNVLDTEMFMYDIGDQQWDVL